MLNYHSYHSCPQITSLAKNARAHPLKSYVPNLQLSTVLPAHIYLQELFTFQPTRSIRSSSCIILSLPRSLLISRSPTEPLSITASRLWNDLLPEFSTFSLPPPLSLQITKYHLQPVLLYLYPFETEVPSFQKL